MSKISQYSNVSPVALTDKLIGTNVGGVPANATKNFLVSDLQTLVISTVNLQHVLDTGNTATQNMTLTGNITQTGTLTVTGDITQSGGAITLGGTVKDFNGSLGNNGETLVCNASGQLVFGSGLTNQNLDQVLAIGNTATNDINLTGNLNLTGNIVETGNISLTGAITHAGAYNYSAGQFTMAATGTMVLGGALTCNSSISLTGTVKDFTDTLGADGQALISDASGQVTWQDVSTTPSVVRFSASLSFNLSLLNQGGVLVMTGAGATNVNIPDNATVAFPTGTKITIIQEGAGQITLVPTAGVTANSAVGLKFSSTNSVAHLVKVDTDKWYAYGDLTP